ncbi:hypothetical protein [Maridesulfovibrio frigidus]|uniref:hypothetical protein n=1 Tax=Maridesulfovibrio frigidus TaxID=340956 RepID=UPI0012EB6E81|nr:hypothetical protein [Maridesulfovibrio frigidus]
MNPISTIFTIIDLNYKTYELKSATYTGQNDISTKFRINKTSNLISVRLTYTTAENAFPFFLNTTGELTSQYKKLGNANQIVESLITVLIPILYDNIRATIGSLTLIGGHQAFLGASRSEIIANHSTPDHKKLLKQQATQMLKS